MFKDEFIYDEINPNNKNKIFSIRANIRKRRFWIGIEFPEDYPHNIPGFFLKGNYVRERLHDVFRNDLIDVSDNVKRTWGSERDIKSLVISTIDIMKEPRIFEKLFLI